MDKSVPLLLLLIGVACGLPLAGQPPTRTLVEVDSLRALGVYWYEQGMPDSSIAKYEAALELIRGVHSEEYLEKEADICFEICLPYVTRMDLDKEQFYYQRALDLYLKVLGENHIKVANLYNDLGLLYGDRGKYEETLVYLEKSLAIYQAIDSLNTEAGSYAYSSMGWTYGRMGEYEKAISFLEKALQIRLKVVGPDHFSVAASLHIIGYTHFYEGKTEKALSFLKKARKIRVAYYGAHHPETSRSYIKIGECYFRLGKYPAALEAFQHALYGISIEPLSEDITLNPAINSIQAKKVALSAARSKAQTLEYYYVYHGKDPAYLKATLESFELAVALLEEIQFTYTSRGSGLAMIKVHYSIFEGGIRAAHNLYTLTGEQAYLDRAFALMEKGKSHLLLLDIRYADAMQFSGIPDTLLTKEVQVRSQKGWSERRLNQAYEQNDSNEISQARASLFQAQLAYDEFIQLLEATFPAYHRLKYNNQILSLSEVQESLLDSQTVMIEYLVGDFNVYIFIASQDSSELLRLPKPPELTEEVEDVLQVLGNLRYSIDSSAVAWQKYSHASQALYAQLIAPVLASSAFSQDVNRLLIVPDGLLNFLPFEVLAPPTDTIGAIDYVNTPYLIRDFAMQYCNSATLMSEAKGIETNTFSSSYTGFAPRYGPNYQAPNGHAVPSLPGAIAEVRSAASRIHGISFLGDEATTHNFKQNAPGSRILHLAMHSHLDEENPMQSSFLFATSPVDSESSYLSAAELYGLQIDAGLVVLSGCETGFGPEEKGDGLASLSRAFAYAGCPALTHSLWQTEDKTNLKLITSYFEGLHTGLPKDIALQRAKLAFLQTADPLTAHPYFWAPFVSTGTPAPVSKGESIQSDLPMWVLPTIGLLILLLLFLGIRKYFYA